MLAAAVITPAGIALGVFVGQHRALRLQHGAADDVLRRNKLDLIALARQLIRHGGVKGGVAVRDVLGEKARAAKGGVHAGLPMLGATESAGLPRFQQDARGMNTRSARYAYRPNGSQELPGGHGARRGAGPVRGIGGCVPG